MKEEDGCLLVVVPGSLVVAVYQCFRGDDHPDDRGSKYPQNSELPKDYTALQPRSQPSSYSLLSHVM
jgi:hypothetical protein